MEIVAASPQDLEALEKVERSCFSKERYPKRMLRSLLSERECKTFFALEEGEVVGAVSIMLAPQTRRAKLASIAVMPKHRGKGIAQMLIRKAENTALAEGNRTMTLEVGTSNVPALNLYLKDGFRIQGIIPDYYGHSKDAFYMEKTLEPTN